jgi:FAD/FMN-containing dehydrogenase
MAALSGELRGLLLETEPGRVAKRSRDFHWFSPILAEELSEVRADAVVAPVSVDELMRVAASCVRYRVPLTVRGGGTGNCGQAMPVKGGVVVDTGYLNRVLAVESGWARAEAGCRLDVLDAALHERGQALRVHPSTRAMATVGGFVAGGSAGVGSVQWGTLRDLGAVRAVRIMTMEETPRLLELRGAHARLALHGFGTTGIITEVEIPTAPATRWFERVVAFASLAAALRFADELAHADAVVKRLVSVIAAPAPGRFLFPHAGVDEATHVVLVMAAETALETFDAIRNEHRGECLAVASSPLFELAWNHTTWHALKHDRALTDLQVAFPPPDHVDRILAMADAFDRDEVIPHLEFLRRGGRVCCSGLPLVRYSTRARLGAIIRSFEDSGCPVVNPHVTTLEAIGRTQVDRTLMAFKREIDPWGLLNPGKIASFDDPAVLAAAPPPFGFKRR